MPAPRTLDQDEAVEVLAPLVLPMIRDQAKIGHPVPGNRDTAGVSIMYRSRYVTLTTDQYELLRVDVLQYVQDRLGSRPGLMVAMGPSQVDSLIRDRIGAVFADE